MPSNTAVFEINGPFFYTVSNLLNEELRQLLFKPKYFILRMRKCPVVDATGIHALKDFQKKCKNSGIIFLMSGLSEDVKSALAKSGVVDLILGEEHIFPHLDDALAHVRSANN